MTLLEQFVYITLYIKFKCNDFSSRELNNVMAFLLRNYQFKKDEIKAALTKFILEGALIVNRNGRVQYRLTNCKRREYYELREAVEEL